MTAIGPPAIGSGVFLLILGIDLNNILDSNGVPYVDGTGYIAGGCILMATGVALTIAGPIEISKGIRHRRAALGQPVTMRLTPISGNFDASFRAKLNQTKLAGLSINF